MHFQHVSSKYYDTGALIHIISSLFIQTGFCDCWFIDEETKTHRCDGDSGRQVAEPGFHPDQLKSKSVRLPCTISYLAGSQMAQCKLQCMLHFPH